MNNKKNQSTSNSNSNSNNPPLNNNSIKSTTYDLTPEWFENYEAMLDIVFPNRTETFIFNLDEKG